MKADIAAFFDLLIVSGHDPMISVVDLAPAKFGGFALMSGRFAFADPRRRCRFSALVVLASLLVPGCGESTAVDPNIKVEKGKTRAESLRPGASKQGAVADPRFGKGPE